MRDNAGLQLRRAISIQADGKKLLEKNATAPSAARLVAGAQRNNISASCQAFRQKRHCFASAVLRGIAQYGGWCAFFRGLWLAIVLTHNLAQLREQPVAACNSFIAFSGRPSRIRWRTRHSSASASSSKMESLPPHSWQMGHAVASWRQRQLLRT